MTPASFTLATVNKTVLKHKQPAHTQKLCVIKQLHNTQRVSMTTRKLLGSSRRSCHCTHACPSRVHCSSNEASSHLEQSTTPVEVHCSAKNSTPLIDGRRSHRQLVGFETAQINQPAGPTHRELVGFETTQINQLNPKAPHLSDGRRSHRQPVGFETTQINRPALGPPTSGKFDAIAPPL